ncbi:MAG: hypothetical protein CFE44_03685 [Burkholderiales bacterium PBB4]|nr:MAG: hypothetical protein CFE44_03685 [Burkholderiales bacterium PBB4]
MTPWLILTATLPTSPSGLRVRIWRKLKATHCATLREGVYILPASAASADAFGAMDVAIRAAGATSHLLELQASDATQEAGFRALFDRSGLYAEFAQSLKDARKVFKTSAEPDIRKTLQTLEVQLQTLWAADFFPGKAAELAGSGLRTLRQEAERRLSPGEPTTAVGDISWLDISDYQGKTWATRTRPWVDRLATAWLLQRFVDKAPTFLWLAHAKQCPTYALGYDFDGATFTHVGERVTFEVVAASFHLDQDPALQRLGAMVHCIDMGGIAADEAPGLELMVRGLHAQHANDDALLAAALPLFDTLYTALRIPT